MDANEFFEEVEVAIFNAKVVLYDGLSSINSACADATASLILFCYAFTDSEALEIAHHPDLAELNVMMDALYS